MCRRRKITFVKLFGLLNKVAKCLKNKNKEIHAAFKHKPYLPIKHSLYKIEQVTSWLLID